MKRAAGFTLIELVVVIAIAIILTAIAIPAWRHMTSANHVTGAVNALASTLSYARSEAISRGEQVTVCPGAPASSCNNASTVPWQDGWFVFEDKNGDGKYDGTDAEIRVHGAVGGQITMPNKSDKGYIAFNRMGFAQPTFNTGDTSLTVVGCPHDRREAHARAVILYYSGAVKTAARKPDTGKPFSCPD